MNESLTCPVCGNKMPNAICGKCGYTRFFFPREMPPQLEKFEQTRIRIMKDCRKKTAKDTQADGFSAEPIKTDVVGTLMVRNLLTESIHAYPIKRGRNIYGGLESNNPVRVFVDPLALGVDIPDVIFGIETSEQGLKLLPHKDFDLSHNRYLIREIIELDNDDYFFHSNTLSFNAVRF